MAQEKYVLPQGVSESQIKPGVLVFKLKSGSSGYERNHFTLDDLPFDAQSIAPIAYQKDLSKNINKPSVLHGIYKVQVGKGENIPALCNQLLSNPDIAYAEPIFQEELLYVPNDPAAVEGGSQDYLPVIQAYEAWDITQGSEDIIIGVIDTGADLDHEDLVGNLYVNEAEEINGVDDDGNGFVDDRIGYDFADEDADAQSDGNDHGSRVGGLAAAETDNGVGMAGLGFRSKLAPLKAFLTSTSESRGNYDAIIYAADNGYDVLNLSWGSINTFSQFNQDIIDYAVLERDMVVIAAGGNSGSDVNFYPAAYDHVLAVGATELNDTKSSFATYSNHVDISAPGSAIFTTNNDSYGNYWGSSFAAPIVAGVAGLVRAQFPDLNAQQVMERIRVTTDDLYAVNPDYVGKLGKGRLNAFRALSETDLKSVRLRSFLASGDNDQVFYYGDSITIQIALENFLSPLQEGSLTISDENNEISYVIDSLAFGALDTGDTTGVSEFKAMISEDADPGSTIDIRFDFQDGDYSDFQQFALNVAPDYLDLPGGETSLTVAGNGELATVESGETGSGLILGTSSIVSEMGLIIAVNKDSLSDNAPVVFGETKSTDFIAEKHIKPSRNTVADQYAYNVFASSDELDLKIEQSSMTWESLDSAMVLSYRLINTSEELIDSLGVGLFVNWELDDPSANQATWDQRHTAFAFNTDANIWAGYRMLTDGLMKHSALDLLDENENTADLGATFTDSLKYTYLFHENPDSAGFSGGNDVANLLGSIFTQVQANQATNFTFLIGFGRNREEMEARLDQAEVLYGTFEESPPQLGEVFSCAGSMVEVSPVGGTLFNYYSDPTKQDTLGISETLLFGPVNRDTVLYVSSADSTYEGPLRTISVRLFEQTVGFSASTETLYLDDDNRITFTDESIEPVSWSWDFGNGIAATVQEPTVIYSEPGIYTVTLQVENADGCIGITSRQVEVRYRPEPLGLDQLDACRGESISIEAETGNGIRIYTSSEEIIPAFEGEFWQIDAVVNDTVIYVSQVVDGHESIRETVNINMREVTPEFRVVSALDSASVDYLWIINETPASVSASWEINGISNSGDTTVFTTTTDPLEISLTVETSFGCIGNRRELVTLSPAPAPVFTPPSLICRGDRVQVSPENGTFFGFFNWVDPEGSFIKSQSLVIDSLTEVMTLGIFGIDGGLPGDTLVVTLSPNAFDFNILAAPDTLYLDQDRSVQFALDTAVQSSQWFINDELAELVEAPIFSFDTAGVYDIRAVGDDADGCIHTENRAYVVYANTPIVLSTQPVRTLNVFPNPVTSEISIESKFEVEGVYVFDLNGTLLLELDELNRVSFELDVSFLESGIYVLQLHADNEVIFHKFRKE